MWRLCYLVVALIIFVPQMLLAEPLYFDKSLDEYNPPLVSDILPKELLKFKPVSFKFYGGTITELKAKTKGGYSQKSNEQNYLKKLHFEWQIKGQLVSLDYYVLTLEGAEKYYGGQKVHPNTYAYLKIIERKLNSVCLGGNCPDAFVETNLPEEHTKCNFYANPNGITAIPMDAYYFIYRQCIIAGGQKTYTSYVGVWSFANVFVEVKANDLELVKKIGQSAISKLINYRP